MLELFRIISNQSEKRFESWLIQISWKSIPLFDSIGDFNLSESEPSLNKIVQNSLFEGQNKPEL